MPREGPILPQKDDPFYGKKETLDHYLTMQFLKLFFTKERTLGLLQHAIQWMAAWLVTKHYLGEPTSEFVGWGMSLGAVLWSAFTGGKENFWQVAAGGIRHVLSMIAAVAVFKGWVDSATANHIIAAVLGLLGPGWSLAAPEKARAAFSRQLYPKTHIRRP